MKLATVKFCVLVSPLPILVFVRRFLRFRGFFSEQFYEVTKAFKFRRRLPRITGRCGNAVQKSRRLPMLGAVLVIVVEVGVKEAVDGIRVIEIKRAPIIDLGLTAPIFRHQSRSRW